MRAGLWHIVRSLNHTRLLRPSMSQPNPTNLVERIVSHDWRRLGKSIASVVLVGLPMGLAASSDSEATISYSAQASIEEASQPQVAKEPISLSLRARNTLRSLASNIASLPIKVVGEAPLNWQQWVHPSLSRADIAESALRWDWAESDLKWALAESDRSWVLPTCTSLKLSSSASDVELGSYHFDFVDLASSRDSTAKAGATESSRCARTDSPIVSIRAAVRMALGVLHQTDIADRHSPKAWFHLGHEPLVEASAGEHASAPSAFFVSERPEYQSSSIALNSQREHASIASSQSVSWANLEQRPAFAFGRVIDPSRYQHDTLS